MLLSRYQNEGRNPNLKLVTEYFKDMAKLKYFGTRIKNINYIHEAVSSRLN
jgi:hypothetical protein